MLMKRQKAVVVGLLIALVTAGWGSPSNSGQVNNSPAPPGSSLPRIQVELKSPIVALAWSPDGKQVATATKDGTIHITDSATGKQTNSFPTGSSLADVAFAPDGKTLATLVSEDRQTNAGGTAVTVWNIATGMAASKSGGVFAATAANRVAFAPDGQTVMGVGFGSLYKWTPSGSSGVGTGLGAFVSVAPDGSIAGWCDLQGKCRMYRFEPGKRPQPFANGITTLIVGETFSIAFGPGAKLLAIGSEDKNVHLWDLAEKKMTNKLSGLDRPATKLVFSADGNALAALAADGTSIHIFDLAHKTTRGRMNHSRGVVELLALSPDGKTLATTAKDGKVLFLWATSARQLNHEGPPLKLSEKEVLALWTDLGDPDYEKADRAWQRLAAAGDNALSALRQQILPLAAPQVDMKKIEKSLIDLDSNTFAIRERAANELIAAGELVIVPLQRLVEAPPSAEVRERATLLLKKIWEPKLTPDRQRVLDAIDLLEQEKTPAAIDLLSEIERAALIPQIRNEARLALQRLGN
jgi:WD40 repeat protein